MLGEDLILFRDKTGRAGLVHPNCAHRGASLYYGKVEERGIRCCYHGWLFDVQGHCVEQPCEPDLGARAACTVRQPWYPVEERYGLVLAYLGPPEKKPVLPRYDALERLDDGEFLEADDNSIGGGGPADHSLQLAAALREPGRPVPRRDPAFELQRHPVRRADGPDAEGHLGPRRQPASRSRRCARSTTARRLRRISEAALPTLRVIPNPRLGAHGRVESIGWVLPIDDHSFRIYTAGRVRQSGDLARVRSRLNGKLWEELSEAEHRDFPGDYEAQVSQGAIASHAEEHLASSDRGIVMLRRLLQRQVDRVRAGEDPLGVSFDPAAEPVRFEAGNYLVDS